MEYTEKQIIDMAGNDIVDYAGWTKDDFVCANTFYLSDTVQRIFDEGMGNTDPIVYSPIAFVGYREIPEGKTYCMFCQATLKDHDPYVVTVELSETADSVKLDSINRLGVLGYSFTWFRGF